MRPLEQLDVNVSVDYLAASALHGLDAIQGCQKLSH